MRRRDLCKIESTRILMPEKSGMTLIEMLLAVGVLALIAAMAWPSVLRMHGEQKIVDAAEKVRTLIAAARVHAIESGLAYQVRVEPNGRSFVAIPFEKEFEAIDQRSGGAAAAEGLGHFSRAAGTLPEKIVFQPVKTESSNEATEAEQKLTPEMVQGLPNADKLSSASWSGPIIFNHDGSSADAEVTIMDQRQQKVSLRIRGLTGAVTVGRLYREELP